MPPKNLWAWKIYFLVILFFVTQKALHLFAPQSPSFLYYFILRSFNPIFYITYGAHVMHVLLSIIHIIPLFLYIYRIHFLSPELWRHLFILRCVFQIIGHSYEMNTLAALYRARPKLLWITAAVIIIPHIPSYLACYWYAFKNSGK